jgi:Protein of unknown function (DUF2997)
MTARKMRIRIAKDGRTEILVEGGRGDDCLAFSRAMEQAVGRVAARQLTSDYHEYDPLGAQAAVQVEEKHKL